MLTTVLPLLYLWSRFLLASFLLTVLELTLLVEAMTAVAPHSRQHHVQGIPLSTVSTPAGGIGNPVQRQCVREMAQRNELVS